MQDQNGSVYQKRIRRYLLLLNCHKRVTKPGTTLRREHVNFSRSEFMEKEEKRTRKIGICCHGFAYNGCNSVHMPSEITYFFKIAHLIKLWLGLTTNDAPPPENAKSSQRCAVAWNWYWSRDISLLIDRCRILVVISDNPSQVAANTIHCPNECSSNNNKNIIIMHPFSQFSDRCCVMMVSFHCYHNAWLKIQCRNQLSAKG